MVGVSAEDPAEGVPPVDSIDFWSSLIVPNGTTSPRNELFLSYSNATFDPTSGQGKGDAALIVGNYKIVIGHQNGRGTWQGRRHPAAIVPRPASATLFRPRPPARLRGPVELTLRRRSHFFVRPGVPERHT